MKQVFWGLGQVPAFPQDPHEERLAELAGRFVPE